LKINIGFVKLISKLKVPNANLIKKIVCFKSLCNIFLCH